MHLEFEYILILLALSVVTVLVISRLNLSPIIGYLLVGIAISTHTTGLIPFSETTHYLGEFGVVFLLFSIGLDFSLSRLYSMRQTVLGLGGAQVLIGTLSGFIIAYSIGISWQASFILGGALALSSTAMVMKQLVDQFELQSEHGLTSLGILLFQDLAAVPFIVLIPILAVSQTDQLWTALSFTLLKGLFVLGLIIFLGKTVITRLFHTVSFSQELFTLTVLLVSLTAAWLTYKFGLSLAFGAFLAGMMVSESRYRYQIENEIRPFRDILLGLFFITVGMQLNPFAILDNWFWVLLLLTGLMFGKALAIYLIMRYQKYSKSIASRTGLILGQGGEFSIALLTLSVLSGLISIEDSQPVLAAVILSMLLAPFLIRNNGRLPELIFGIEKKYDHLSDSDLLENVSAASKQFVLLCGYGSVGDNIARKLEEQGIEFLALETKAEIVQENWSHETPVYFGDATKQTILKSAGIMKASAVVICVQDDQTAGEILRQIKYLREDIPVLISTHDIHNHEIMLDSGASQVIAETQEVASSIAAMLMKLDKNRQ